ncbi:RHS repeat protein [Flavobacteriaceae bacterium TK19130]|nr:RHS repeat protein [Thermobacterium salinum]
MHCLKILILSFLVTTLSSAQSDPKLPDLVPPSPEAASLAKFVETPISHFTGVPEISIPVTELKSGGKTIPVSVAYHASGIRVNEMASRVGLGWSLSAGGSITRSVRGIPDDSPNVYGYLNDHDVLGDFMCLRSGGGISCNSPLGDNYSEVMYNIEQGEIDLQSDSYMLNFPGGSGKFHFDEDKDIFFNPKSDMSIEFIMPNGVILGWIVTDTVGTKYYFGLSEDQIRSAYDRTTSRSFGQGFPSPPPNSMSNYITAWHLVEVKPYNGAKLSLYYSPGFNTTIYNLVSHDYWFWPKFPNANCSGSTQPDPLYTISEDFNVRLTSIEGASGKVRFNYGSNRTDLVGDKVLTSIDLVDPDSNTVNSWDFSHSYFVSDAYTGYEPGGAALQTQNDYRLRLDGITNGDSEHTFEYYDSDILPNRFSTATDLFGFYNGDEGSNIPKIDFFDPNGDTPHPGLIGIGSSYKYIDADKTRSCTLKSITYPTKGKVEFQYESNTVGTKNYNFYVSQGYVDDFLGDIDSSLGQYSEQFTVSGDTFPTTKIVELDFTTINPNGLTCSGTEYEGPCPVIELKEVSTGQTIELYSVWTDRVRHLLDSGTYEIEITYPGSPPINNRIDVSIEVNQKKMTNGKIEAKVGGLRTSKVIYRNHDDSILLSKEYGYHEHGNPNKSSGRTLNPPVLIKENVYTCVASTNNILVPQQHWVLSSNLIYPFTASNGNLVGYTNVTERITGQSNNRKDYEFSFNYDAITSFGQSTPTIDMDDKFTYYQVTPLLVPQPNLDQRTGEALLIKSFDESDNLVAESEFEYIGNSNADLDVSSLNFVTKRILLQHGSNTWEYLYNETYNNYSERRALREKIQKQYYGSQEVSTTTTHYYGNETVNETLLYNGRSFPIASRRSQSNGMSIITETDYPQDRPTTAMMDSLILHHRIAEPIEVRKILGESMGETLLSTKRTKYADFNGIVLPYQIMTKKGGAEPVPESSMETRIVYHSYDSYGNPREVSKKDGMRTSYVWGYNGQYPVAKVEGKGYSQLPGTLVSQIESETDALTLSNLLDSLRNHNYLQNSLVTTYTYDPLVGVTSITDPKGDTRSFEYDEFGRLEAVRDADGNLLSENEYNYGQ